MGDVPFEEVFNTKQVNKEILQFYENLKDLNITPMTVGGDHSITYPILKGLLE
eukprot:UN13011